jgi:hypothetical protein
MSDVMCGLAQGNGGLRGLGRLHEIAAMKIAAWAYFAQKRIASLMARSPSAPFSTTSTPLAPLL